MSAALTAAERRLYVAVLAAHLVQQPYQLNNAATAAALAVASMRELQKQINQQTSTLPYEVQMMLTDALDGGC